MIRLRGATRTFTVGEQEVRALDAVDLDIGAGEYLAIVGPSGSGKSTLLNAIGLLDRLSHGSYWLNETDVTDLSDELLSQLRREAIGFVFQFFHLIPRLSAFQNIELPMVLAGTRPDERSKRVTRLLDDFGLADRAQHRPDQLSGGQRQRVAIARATVMQPSLLLADEPTGNLDQRAGREVIEILEDLNREGLTLLVVTHDSEISDRAPRKIRMLDGRVVGDVDRSAP